MYAGEVKSLRHLPWAQLEISFRLVCFLFGFGFFSVVFRMVAICWESAVLLDFWLCCFISCRLNCLFSFPGFLSVGRMWNSIVLVLDHCLSSILIELEWKMDDSRLKHAKSNYFKIMQFFTRNWVYTNLSLKIWIFYLKVHTLLRNPSLLWHKKAFYLFWLVAYKLWKPPKQ